MKNVVGTTSEGLVRLDAADCEGGTLVHLYTLVGPAPQPLDPVMEADVEALLPP